MNRREILKSAAAALGCTLAPSTMTAILSGCSSPQRVTKWRPHALAPEQDLLIVTLTELIIPQTDTPGAAAARVNEFIDLMLSEWCTEAERMGFLAGLEEVERMATQRYGTPFVECGVEDQTAILKEMEERAASAAPPDNNKAKPFFPHLKELTVVGYYTSEIGASQELQYIGAADTFKGCVPLSEIGRAWSNPSR